MTILELALALKPHDLNVFPDTGGIYSSVDKNFIASISGVDRNKLPVSIAVVRLNRNHIDTHPEYFKAIQTICAINDISVIGAD